MLKIGGDQVVPKSMMGLTACVLGLILAGCAEICIFNVEDSSIVVLNDAGSFREEPLYSNESGFATLKRTETNAFEKKTYMYNGKEVERTYLPLWFLGYGDDDYAFSKDGKHAAYLELSPGTTSTSRLILCAVEKPTKNILPQGFCDKLPAYRGYRVFWIDATTLLLYAKNSAPWDNKRRKNKSYMVHINDMSVTSFEGYYDTCGPVLLSPSSRYLLASEGVGTGLRQSIHIVDLNAVTEIFSIVPNGGEMKPYGAVWSSDDEIVFTTGNVVYMLKVGSTDKKEVFRVKSGRGVCLHAVDKRRNLHYQLCDVSKSYTEEIGGWRTYNLDTKEDKALTGKHISGKVLMNTNRDKLVVKVGF